MNLLEEMVRNLKKDLATPKPKQYGEPPNWNPSNLPNTNKNSVKGTTENNELANFFASMSTTSESKTLYGQPPDSIMNAGHIRLVETKQREEQQIKNRNKSVEMKMRNEKIIEFENTNNNIRRSDGSSSNNIRRNNFSNNRGNDVSRRNFPCAASQLKISIPMDQYGNEFIQNCNQKRANGYSEENAKKAMLHFQKRNLFSIDDVNFRQSRPLPENWGRTVKICEKLITVPTIADANSVSFVGEGMTEVEAEMNCDLNILEELYNFDVIKEAAIEMYSKGRKELIDPARKMDEKLKAWMKSEKIFQKLDKIEVNENNFY